MAVDSSERERIALFDTRTHVQDLRPELDAVLGRALDDGQFILGPDVANFEKEFGDYLAAPHVIGVANGTDALTLSLLALGVGPGDEVVVPSFTFWASAESIPPTGARPVFCDMDLETYTITEQTVKAALTPRTKAIIAVDLFGNVADIEAIGALGVPVVEDAAQAAGSTRDGRKAGGLGTITAFSFYPSKNLGCFGDGGAVVTHDAAIADRVRMLRAHGAKQKGHYELIGYNSRLDTMQAAILRVFLPHLDGWAARRRAIGERYREGLAASVAVPRPGRGVQPAWHLYVIRDANADVLQEHLRLRSIACSPYYRVPAHRQPAMAALGADRADLPATEEAARTHLAIPMGPTLTNEQVDTVIEAVIEAAGD